MNSNKKFTDALLEQDKDVFKTKEDANYVLHLVPIINVAVLQCDLNFIEFLVNKGADVNSKSPGSTTPLHLAVYHNRNDVADLLIRNGADVNFFDERRNNPVTIAISKNNSDFIKTHMSSIDLTYKNHKKETYLFYSVNKKNVEMTKIFLDAKMNVNHVNSNGETVLNSAVIRSDYKMVELLLQYGARNFKGRSNMTPREHAFRLGDSRISSLFKNNLS